MASRDDPERNAEFARSLNANFPVLSDPGGETARAYGVVARLRGTRRWTFYIDPDGIIRSIDRKVSVSDHGETIAKKLAELGFPRE